MHSSISLLSGAWGAIMALKLKASSLWIFLVPTLIIIFIFFFIPAILTVLISFTSMTQSLEWTWVGIKNYIDIFTDFWMPKIFMNTLFYVFATLAFFNAGLALVVSLLTVHINEKAGSIFRSLWLLPRITPSTVYVLLWLWASRSDKSALFNWFLGFFGIPAINWKLAQPWMLVIFINGFVGVSFGMIVFTAALKSIPRDLIWASKVDGTTTLQQVRYIELPLIRWPLLFVIAYQTLSLLTSYQYILIATDGGPGFYETEVIALHAYHLGFKQYGGIMHLALGASYSVILVIIGVVLALVYLKVFRFRELMIEPKIEV